MDCQKVTSETLYQCLSLSDELKRCIYVIPQTCRECRNDFRYRDDLRERFDFKKQTLPGKKEKILSLCRFALRALGGLVRYGVIVCDRRQRAGRLNICVECPDENYREIKERPVCVYGCGCTLDGPKIVSLTKYAVARCKFGHWEPVENEYKPGLWRTRVKMKTSEKNRDLVSIIIVSRNEQYLNPTIKNLLHKATGPIELIVIADGPVFEPVEGLRDTDTIIYNETPRGRRPATDQAVSYAKGTWLLNVDAHVKTDVRGYDRMLIDGCDHKTMIVVGLDKLKVDIWKNRGRRMGHKYVTHRLKDSWSGVKPKEKFEETIIGNGMGWFLAKEYYEAFGGCDKTLSETWGSFGLEWGLKVWLSDPDGRGPGRVLLSRDIVFGHLWKKSTGYKAPGAGGNRVKLLKWVEGKGENQVRPFTYFEEHLPHLIPTHRKGNKKPFMATKPDITVLMNTNGLYPELTEEAIESFLRQDYPNKQLLIFDTSGKLSMYRDYDNIKLRHIQPFNTFPEQIANAIQQVKTPYWTIMDSDDIHFSDHLTQLMDGMQAAKANGLESPCYVINPRAYQWTKRKVKIRNRAWWTCLYERVEPEKVQDALRSFREKSKKDTGFDLHFIKRKWWNRERDDGMHITSLQRLGIAFHIRRGHGNPNHYKEGLERAELMEPHEIKPHWRQNYETQYREELPEVTVVMNTYGRDAEQIEEAIEGYIRQDYPNKKMIIVNTHPGELFLTRYCPDITVHNAKDFPGGYNEQRLFAYEAVDTELWIKVDDDDVMLPWHITQLVAAYRGKALCNTTYFRGHVDSGILNVKRKKAVWWNCLFRRDMDMRTVLNDPDLHETDKRFMQVAGTENIELLPSYIYRRSGGIKMSKMKRNSHKQKLKRITIAKRGAYEIPLRPLTPHWKFDYVKQAREFIEAPPLYKKAAPIYPLVTAVCCTYGAHKELTEEAIYSFLMQDYPNKKMVILNTHPDPIRFDGPTPGIEVIEKPDDPFESLTEKHCWLINQIESDLWFVMDDDDIILPWHIANLVELWRSIGPTKRPKAMFHFRRFVSFQNKLAWLKKRAGWTTYLFEGIDEARLKRIIPEPWTAARCYDRSFRKSSKWSKSKIDLPVIPSQIWRGQTGTYHLTATGSNPAARKTGFNVARKKAKRISNQELWRPHWTRDYVTDVLEFIAAGAWRHIDDEETRILRLGKKAAIRVAEWEYLQEFVEKHKIRNVVEFGSGVSTQYFYAIGCNVLALETVEKWAEKTRMFIEWDCVELWDGKPFDPETFSPVDLIFIDGPDPPPTRAVSYEMAAKMKTKFIACHDTFRDTEQVLMRNYLLNAGWELCDELPPGENVLRNKKANRGIKIFTKEGV